MRIVSMNTRAWVKLLFVGIGISLTSNAYALTSKQKECNDICKDVKKLSEDIVSQGLASEDKSGEYIENFCRRSETQACNGNGKECALRRTHAATCTSVPTIVVPDCLAYNATKKDSALVRGQEVLAITNTVAAGVCMIACIWPVNAVGCQIAGIGAGVAELSASIYMAADNKTGELASAIGIVGGAGGAGLSAFYGAAQLHTLGGATDNLKQEAADQAATESHQRTLACTQAAIFTGMATYRLAVSLPDAAKVSDSSCDDILDKISIHNATPRGLSELSPNGAGGLSGSGNSSALSGSQTAGDTTLDKFDRCITESGGTIGECANAAGIRSLATSVDGALLSNKRFPPGVSPKKVLDQINKHGLENTFRSLTSGRGDKAGAALAALSGAVQRDPSLMGGTLNKADANFLAGINSGDTYQPTGGTSGAGSNANKPGGLNLNALFGAGAGGPKGAGAPAAVIQFGRAPSSTDIWHTGTNQSLFEIVSGKYDQVANRFSTQAPQKRTTTLTLPQ